LRLVAFVLKGASFFVQSWYRDDVLKMFRSDLRLVISDRNYERIKK